MPGSIINEQKFGILMKLFSPEDDRSETSHKEETPENTV